MPFSPYQDITDPEFFNILEESTILRVVTGSTAYGLNTATSDVDEKSIVILPKEIHFRLEKEFETVTSHEPDREFHTLKKFVTLANSQNPTILEMLHTKPEFITAKHPVVEKLIANAHLFLSSNCFNSYGGYAREQLMRIKNGLNRTTLSEKTKFLRETLENIIATFELHYSSVNTGVIMLDSVRIDEEGKANVDLRLDYASLPLKEMYGMASELTNATKNINKMGARNKRAEDKLEKHAMHLIRLLICGIEVLETGRLNVFREHDREFLLDIRNGKYTWDEIFEIVAELENKLQLAKQKTVLPKATDFNVINALFTEMTLEYYEYAA